MDRSRRNKRWYLNCDVGDYIFELDAALTNQRFATLEEARHYLTRFAAPENHEIYLYHFIDTPGVPASEEFVDSFPGVKP